MDDLLLELCSGNVFLLKKYIGWPSVKACTVASFDKTNTPATVFGKAVSLPANNSFLFGFPNKNEKEAIEKISAFVFRQALSSLNLDVVRI